MYDPQIGRFHQIDPLSDLFEGYSPYVFALNNPILLNDPFGLSADTAVLEPVIVTPSNNRDPMPEPVCLTCNEPAPMPSAMVPFIPTESDFVVAPEEVKDDYKWYQYFNDHNPGGDILYEINKYNPLALLVNGGKTLATGKDTYGVPQSNAEGVT